MLCARVHCPRFSRDPDVTLMYFTIAWTTGQRGWYSCFSAVNKLPGQPTRDQSILPIQCFFSFPSFFCYGFHYCWWALSLLVHYHWCTICPGMRANPTIQQGIYNDRHVANLGSCVCSHLATHPTCLVYIATSQLDSLFWFIGEWFIVLLLLICLDKHHRFLQIRFGARGARRVQFCQFTIDLIYIKKRFSSFLFSLLGLCPFNLFLNYPVSVVDIPVGLKQLYCCGSISMLISWPWRNGSTPAWARNAQSDCAGELPSHIYWLWSLLPCLRYVSGKVPVDYCGGSDVGWHSWCFRTCSYMEWWGFQSTLRMCLIYVRDLANGRL